MSTAYRSRMENDQERLDAGRPGFIRQHKLEYDVQI